MNSVLVSVIMANYNTPIEYLKIAIDSILNQTYSNFEFILIDDASNDESLDFILSYDDSRIRLIRNPQNLGLTKSLNKGLSIAKGKYIIRMDSDDISLPKRIEKQLQYMESNPDVFVCGTWFEKFGVENIIRKPILDDSEWYRCQLLFSNTPITMCHPSVIIRKSMLDKYKVRYDESIRKAQDYAMWVECSKYGKMAILQDVLLKYRTHDNQISIGQKKEQYEYSDLISRRQLQKLGIEYQNSEINWRYDKVVSEKEYKDFYVWIESIRTANRKKKTFDCEAMDRYLNQKLKNAIKRLNFLEKTKVLLFSNKESKQLFFELLYHSIRRRINP